MALNYLPATYHWGHAVAGDTFKGFTSGFQITVNSAAPSNALSAVSIRFWKDAKASGTPFLTLSSADGDIAITSAANWTFTIAAFTAPDYEGVLYYKMLTTDSAGAVRTYVKGTWTLDKGL